MQLTDLQFWRLQPPHPDGLNRCGTNWKRRRKTTKDAMQSEIEKTKNTDTTLMDAWDAIVRLTDNVGSDAAKSIRILLYLVIAGAHRSNFRSRIRDCARFFRRLDAPRRNRLPSVRKGRPLF